MSLIRITNQAEPATPPAGTTQVYTDIADKRLATKDDTGLVTKFGGGDVNGPATSTNNAIAVYDGTNGELLKDSALTVSGSTITGNVTGTAGSTTGNAATVTVADAGGDTTTSVLLGTSPTGNLSPATDAGLTYNATTNALTATGGFIGSLLGSVTIPALTLGSVVFAGTGGLLSQDNANLFWDNTAKMLGIGTETPEAYLEIVNETASTDEFVATKYFSGVSAAAIVGRHARGTEASPTATLLDDRLVGFGGRGYGATGFAAASSAIMFMTASENWTDTAQGTYISWLNTVAGSTTRKEYMRLDSGGNLSLALDATNTFLPAGVNNILRLGKTFTDGTTNQNSILIDVDSTVSGAGISQVRGMLVTVKNSGITSGTGLLSGIFYTVTGNGTQNYLTNNFTGLSASIATTASQVGTIVDTNGIRINAPSFAGTKPTTSYGAHIFNQGVSGSTASYAYYAEAQTGATNSYGIVIAGGNSGFGVTAPTAKVHLGAGTTAAGTAPLKLNSGSLLTAPEVGAIEFLTDAYYGTITTGVARKQFLFTDGSLASNTGLPVSTGISGLGTGIATFLATPSSANLATAITDETGTGALVFANSPVLVTPALGTPASGVATNLTGTAAGLTAGNVTTNANLTGAVTSVGNATSLGSFTSAQLATALTDETGTGAAVFATSPVLVTPALGTPSALVGTNITGTAAGLTAGNVTTNANLTGVVTSVGNATSLGSFTSAQLATALTNETGSGVVVFDTSPALTGTPTAPTAAAGTNTTQIATTAFATAINNNASYRIVLEAQGSHIAGQVAGTYMLPKGDALAVSGTGVVYPIGIISIVGADWPTINGITPKLRVRATVSVNNTAPTGNFTVGLYPLTSGAGGAGVKTWTTGTLVTGSGSGTVTTPAGSSTTTVTGSDFAVPADGVYCLACVTTATVAASSLVQVNAIMQMRNT